MIKLTTTNHLQLDPVDRIPRSLLEQIRTRLTFPNPAFLEAEKRGFWTGNLDREIKGYQVVGDTLVLPRGYARQLTEALRYFRVPYKLVDLRRTLVPVNFAFTGKLRDFQDEAMKTMAFRDFGTLAAPTGSGKTVIALALVAQRRQPALVVVHTRELLAQWIDRIGTFLGIPAAEVGIIGRGKVKVGEKITVALCRVFISVLTRLLPMSGTSWWTNVTGPPPVRSPRR